MSRKTLKCAGMFMVWSAVAGAALAAPIEGASMAYAALGGVVISVLASTALWIFEYATRP